MNLLSMLATTLALALPQHSMAHISPIASRAIGHPVICLSLKDFNRAARSLGAPNDAEAFWLPSARMAFLVGGKWSDCWELEHPLVDSPVNVSLAIFILGHEAAHGRQEARGLPFDECQADHWSVRGFRRLQRRLGITRHLPAPRPFWFKGDCKNGSW